jgi:hypothetical protein
MTEKIAKPEIIIHSKFHGSIQGVNFDNQLFFNSISWFLGEFEDDEDIVKRKMLLETEFIEALDYLIERNYIKYDYELAEIENALHELFSKPVSEMEPEYQRLLGYDSQEQFIETVQKLYRELGGKI